MLGCSDSTVSSEAVLSYRVCVLISQLTAPSSSADTAAFWSCAVNLAFKKIAKGKVEKPDFESRNVSHVPDLVGRTAQQLCFGTSGDVAMQK